ncbi:MAG: immunoglobulin domain-containing protein [Verrucomicrobia bacterium]|nr:immunoglobulin domain-containing protein [Verrucomicrobiota bacterium]
MKTPSTRASVTLSVGVFVTLLLLPSSSCWGAAPASPFLWATALPGDHSVGVGIAVGGDGDCYVAFNAWEPIDLGDGHGLAPVNSLGSCGIMKLTASGSTVLARLIPAPAAAGLRGIAADADGNVFVTGWFERTPVRTELRTEIFLAKFDRSGAEVWSKQSRQRTGDGSATGAGVAVDAAGNCYFTGSFTGALEFGTPSTLVGDTAAATAIVLSFDKTGNFRWLRNAEFSLNGVPEAITVDSAGGVFVAGSYRSASGGRFSGVALPASLDHDVFIAKYGSDNQGLPKWVKTARAGGFDDAYAVAPDGIGGCYISGVTLSGLTFGATSTPAGGFLAKYSANGAPLWGKSLGLDSTPSSLAADGSGNIYLAGSSYPSPTGPPRGEATVLLFDSSGRMTWTLTSGGNDYDTANGIVAFANGDVFLTGQFQDTATFGNRTFNAGVAALFAARLVAPLPPYIATQPQNQSAAEGRDAVFQVSVFGPGESLYQWFKDGAALNNATNASLTLPKVQPSDAGSYSVQVRNAFGTTSSDSAQLVVVPLAALVPKINEPPKSQGVAEGSTVTLRVTASGAVPLLYQWFKDEIVLNNKTDPTLTLANVQTTDTGNYTVQVSNGFGSVTSAPARLDVLPFADLAPKITEMPLSQTVEAGSTVTFRVTATGAAPLSYRWFKGSNLLNDQTNATLTLTNVQIDDTGTYAVWVWNSTGLIVGAATLTVVETINVLVTTLAGSGTPGFLDAENGLEAQFDQPNSPAVTSDGVIFVPDGGTHLLRFITPSGAVGTFAGQPQQGFADGPAEQALFNMPLAVALEPTGALLVADTENNRIRRISARGVRTVTTVAGSGQRGLVDGPAGQAAFNFPNDLVVDRAGNLFLTEFLNHTIRKITPGGTVSTFVGDGTAGATDGRGTAARLNQPAGITMDSAGNLYVTEWAYHRIRKVQPDGTVTTLVGTGRPGFTDGLGVAGRFNIADAITVDAQGFLYVTEVGNHAVRRVSPGGRVSTLAGLGVRGFADGDKATALFNHPTGIAVHPDGTLIVTDVNNRRIRRIDLNPGAPKPPAKAAFVIQDLQPTLTLHGEAGKTYRIESAEEATPATWTAVTTLTLARSPEQWTDPLPAARARRFYRAVEQ